jgi:hypothetical protein
MRFAILLSLFLSGASFGQGRFDRFNQRTDQGRSTRGFEQSSGAFFEFAPASGAGMGTACACTAVTGAKGEAMTFTRTGNATCYPLGLATSGITNASLVECGTDLPRVESSGGVLGLRVEGARTNVLTRFIDYANATWADVATPTLTGAQASPWTGTYANLAVQFDDNDAVAFEGRTQTVTVTAATQYTMSCLVKAGTLSSWTLSLDGTTASGTGLSSTTWSRVTVTDASSSGVAIAAQALNGSVVGDTGTVIWGGCQVEAGAYATSYIPTVAAAVTRNAEAPSLSVGTGSWGCESASFSVAGYTAAGSNQRVLTLAVGGDLYDQYIDFSGASLQHFTFLSAVIRQHATSNAPAAAGSTSRVVYRQNGTTLVTELDGTTTTSTPSAYTPLNGAATLHVGKYTGGGFELNGIVSRLQLDPSPTRCTP